MKGLQAGFGGSASAADFVVRREAVSRLPRRFRAATGGNSADRFRPHSARFSAFDSASNPTGEDGQPLRSVRPVPGPVVGSENDRGSHVSGSHRPTRSQLHRIRQLEVRRTDIFRAHAKTGTERRPVVTPVEGNWRSGSWHSGSTPIARERRSRGSAGRHPTGGL